MKFGLRREMIEAKAFWLSDDNPNEFGMSVGIRAVKSGGVDAEYTFVADLSNPEVSRVYGTVTITSEEDIRNVHRHGKALARFSNHITRQINRSDIDSKLLIDVIKRLPDENRSMDFEDTFEKCTDLVAEIRERELELRREYLSKVLDSREKVRFLKQPEPEETAA